MSEKIVFPKDFLWGSATAAHQVEGNNIHSDWWAWEKNGGTKEASKLACDHYRRFEEDFDLIQKLNQNAHRFSIEWARIEPKEGKWDKEALKHYRKVLESLRKRKIKSFVTLFHFTLPLWFAQKGGFSQIENLKYFERYTQFLVKNLGDLVDFWLTINEPNIYVSTSYLGGLWPPQKRSLLQSIKVFINLAKAHKKAYKIIHEFKSDAKVGMAMNISTYNSFGGYFIGMIFSKLTKLLISDSFYLLTQNFHDFLGVNYYFFRNFSIRTLKMTHAVYSDLGWLIYPKGLYDVCLDLKKYHLPIYITENGIADKKDILRTEFVLNHLRWLFKAIEEGVDVKGYLHWTLMDNYEWTYGFKPRFGLVAMDPITRERKIRKSALVYAKICKANGF